MTIDVTGRPFKEISSVTVTPTTLGLVIGTDVQAHGAKLDSIQALANAAGWLHNNGAGVFAYTTPTYAEVGADAAGAASTVQTNLNTHAALTTTAHGLGASAFHADSYFVQPSVTSLASLTSVGGAFAIAGAFTGATTIAASGQMSSSLASAASLANATAAIKLFDASLGAGLFGGQLSGSPYPFQLQVSNAAFSFFFPLSLNPLGGVVNLASSGIATNVLGTLAVTGTVTLGGGIVSLNTSSGYLQIKSAAALYLRSGPATNIYIGDDTNAQVLIAGGGGLTTVGGALTIASTATIGAAENPVQIGRLSDATTYGAISFNSSFVAASIMGIYGRANGAIGVTFNTPTGTVFSWGVQGVEKMSLSAAGGFTVGYAATFANTVSINGGTGGNPLDIGGANGNISFQTATYASTLGISGNIAGNFDINNTTATGLVRLYGEGGIVLRTATTLSSTLAVTGAATFSGTVSTGALTATSATVNGVISRVHAAGTEGYLQVTTTGVQTTALGFNNSGSTNAQGVPNNTSWVGTLNSYPFAITAGGYLIATFTGAATPTTAFAGTLAATAINLTGANGVLLGGNSRLSIASGYTKLVSDGSGLLFQDNAGTTNIMVLNNSGNVEVAGTFKIGSRPGFVASDKYLLTDSSGNIHVSALGPAS